MLPVKTLLLPGLKKLDFFSKPIQLNFNHEKYFRTYFGGIISLLICIIISCSVWGWFSLIINKHEARISRVDMYSPTAPQINFNSNNSLFAFNFYAKNFSIFNDPTYFDQDIFLQTLKLDTDGIKLIELKPLTFKKCREILSEDSSSISKKLDEISIIKLNSSFCLELKNETIIGSTIKNSNFNNEYYFSNFLFSLKKCKNNSLKVCKSEQELNEKLKGGFLEFLFIDNFFDLKNPINPSNSYLKNLIFYVDMRDTKIVEIFLKIIDVITDMGWFFEDNENIKDFTYDFHQQQNIEMTNQSEIIKLFINTSNNKLEFLRTYIKIQEVVGNIGGILYLTFIFGHILTHFQSNFETNERMINSLFYIIEKRENNRKSTSELNGTIIRNETFKNELRDFGDLIKANNETKFNNVNDLNYVYNKCARKRNSSIAQINSQNFVRQINTNKRRSLFNFNFNVDLDFNKQLLCLKGNEGNNVNESHMKFLANCQRENKNSLTMSPQKKFKYLKPEVEKNLKEKFQNLKDQFKNKYPLDFCSVLSYYISKLCFKQSKNKYLFFRVAYNKLCRYLDYTNVIKTVKEFKKLKKIILTKNQMILLSSPKVSFIDDNKVINYNFTKKRCPTEEFENLELSEIYKSYLKAKSKAEDSSKNRKIVDNFEEQLKNIFESVEKDEKLKL
jgi:hypothetical protein